MRVVLFLLFSSLAFARFGTPQPVTISRAGFSPARPYTADFNQDGIADVATFNFGPPPVARGGISVTLGSRTTPFAALTELPVSGIVTTMATGDLNRDSKPDLLVLAVNTSTATSDLCAYLGTGTGAFGSPICTARPTNGGVYLEIADFNRDGTADVAIAANIDNNVTVLLGNGNGTFRSGSGLSTNGPSAVFSGDWTGDGVADLAIYSVAGAFTFARGTGSSFVTVSVLPAPPQGGESAAGDLNGDGRPDIFIPAGYNGGSAYLFLSSAGTFTLSTVAVPSPGSSGFDRARMMDLDGDGDTDVFVGSGVTWVLTNDGSGNLTIDRASVQGTLQDYRVADFNADGLPDIFDVSYSSTAGANAARVMFGEAASSSIELKPATTTSIYGQPVRLTATFLSTSDAVPGATELRLMIDGRTIATSRVTMLTIPPPNNFPGLAYPVAFANFDVVLPAGDQTVSVFFPGNASVAPSTSNSVRVGVAPVSTSVRLFSSAEVVSDRDAPASFDVAVDAPGIVVNEGVVRAVANNQVVVSAPVVNGMATLKLPAGLTLGPIAAVLQYSGTNFLPSSNAAPSILVRGRFVLVSSAYPQPLAARGGIATLGLPGLGVAPRTTPDVNWPTSLSSVQVEVADAQGILRAAPLAYVGPGQINFLMPADTPAGGRLGAGAPTVRVKLGTNTISEGSVAIADVAPGIYTANSAGTGVPAALAGLYSAAGNQDVPVFSCAASGCVPAAMPLGTGDQQLVLSLYGTGIRNRATPARAFIGGTEAEVLYAGAQNVFPGLDQINVRIDKNVFRAGEFDLTLTVDGQTTPPVRIALK